MGIPNLRELEEMRRLREQQSIIVCTHCSKPLWRVKILGSYGEGPQFITEEESFQGVPDYCEYYSKKLKGYLRTDCPFCGEQWFTEVRHASGANFAVPKII